MRAPGSALSAWVAGFAVREISIVDWQFRVGIVIALVAVLASSWLWLRRRLFRWGARALCVPLLIALVGAGINAHYDYFPTLGALLGRNAADQVSASTFTRLEHRYRRQVRGASHYGRQISSPGSLPARGVVLAFSIPATVSHFPARTGQVYLPPVWFESPHPHLPVIELLHGSPGSPADWTRGGGADLTADKYAQTHDGFAPILVMPDVNGVDWQRDSECVDGPEGNAETYLTVDVRNAVVHSFGARADGASWGVAGLSEGGSCALQMGLRHPDLFRAVGDFSGDDHPWINGGLKRLFWGTTPSQLLRAEQSYDPRAILSRWHSTDAPAIDFSSGRTDHVLPKMQRLFVQAQRDHIAATLEIFPGGHTFWLWNQSFAWALPWMMRYLGGAHTPRLVSARSAHKIAHARLHA